MKRNYRNLFMVGMLAIAACFTGCKEAEVPALSVTVNGSETFAEEIRSTSASFTIKTSEIEAVAYCVEEGNVSENGKNATVIYAEAEDEGRVVVVADGNNTINVYSLEGGSEYTIFFVYKKEGKLELTSKVFTTPAYDRIITVVESMKEGFKFHINVPEDMTYKYAFLPTEQYYLMRSYGWADDVTFLEDGRTETGSQTIEIYSEEDWIDEGDGGFYIHPGSAYTLLVGECDAEGNLLYEPNPNLDYGEEDWGGEVWGPWTTRAGSPEAPRMGAYTEEIWVNDEFYPTGLYARQNLLAALTMVESQVEVEVIGKTERRIKLRCTAEDDVQYVIAPMSKGEYDNLVGYVTEDAIASTLLEYYGIDMMMTGSQDFEVNEDVMYMEPDSTYVIGVVGVYAEDASVLSYEKLEVTLTKSTRPAAEVTITQGTNPDGEETPDMAWFNIKSEKQNVFAAKHIANYTKEVAKQINSGSTLEDLIGWYGEPLTEDDIQAINSEAGLTIGIPSMEDAETTLIIGAYNEDEGMTIYTGVSRSAALPALEPVNSTLFEDLKGEWTARIIQRLAETFYYYEEDDVEFENLIVVDSVWFDTIYTTITLGADFDNSPAVLDENDDYYIDAYAHHYLNAIENGATEEAADEYAKEQVENQFADYKEKVERYKNKYEGQNYILGLGLGEVHDYASPWDLFCSTDYVAYDVEELFYAFGPKLFFQVQADGSLMLLGDANISYLPPVAGWQYYDMVLMGYNYNYEDAGMFYNGSYEVEVNEDSLVIKGYEYEGEFFYPSLGAMAWGWPSHFTKPCADIVLTRGVAEDVEDELVDMTRAANLKGARMNNRIKRTYLPSTPLKVKTSKATYVPVLDNLKSKYSK